MLMLSTGAIERILNGSNGEFPFLQIMGVANYSQDDTYFIRRLFPRSSIPGEVFRILLWDGDKPSSDVLLHPALNNLLYNKRLKPHTLICITDYILMNTYNYEGEVQKVVVVKDITIVSEESKHPQELLTNDLNTTSNPDEKQENNPNTANETDEETPEK